MHLYFFNSITVIVLLTDVTHGKAVPESHSIYSRLTPAQYLPSGKYLKLNKLRRRLGKHFDPEWMAVDIGKRRNGLADQNTRVVKDRISADSYSKDLKKWSEQFIATTNIVKNDTLQTVFDYLLRISQCKVIYQWEDMGPLFWPRFVKSGTCESRGRSCSWPPGMTCQPGTPHVIRILRWVCKRRVRKKKKKNVTNRTHHLNKTSGEKTRITLGAGKVKCKWKPVPYEVTSNCVCSCLNG